MSRTLRFYLKYAGQIVLVYLAFAAFVLAGAFVQGSLNGIVGTYAAMLPTMGLMFGGLFASSIDVYFNVAVSMGARRSHCFWAGQIATAVGSLLLPPLSVLVYRLLAGFPDRVEVLREYSLREWGYILLGALVVQQLGLLASRIGNVKAKMVGMIVMMLLAMSLMVSVTLAGVPQMNPVQWGVLGFLARYLHGILAAAAVLLGAVVYRRYQKAVVTL